jgi:DNA-binding beta-propeller fold protein YncE
VKTSLVPAAITACSQRPKWNIIQLSRPSVDPMAACSSLLGGLKGDMARRGFDDDDLDLGGIIPRSLGGKLPPPSMEEMGRFHVKSPKDVRECGVTDIALTSSGCVIVVDKHNKLVKMFDAANAISGRGTGSSNGRSNSSVATFIGTDCLKEPARVTVLRSVDHILVTDVGRAAVVEFDSKGNFVRTFVSNLKYPASVAEAADGSVAVVDYETKEVVFFDEGGSKMRSVKCGGGEKACPAFTICTTDGRLISSDWQNNTVSVVDAATGDSIATLTSADGVRFKQPHGLAEDPFGNILVMDKGNHRMLVLDRDTFDVICAYNSDKERHSMRLPMSAAFSSRGDQLLVADYQGYVRAFKYTTVSKRQFVTERSLTNASMASLVNELNNPGSGNDNVTPAVNHSTVFVKPAANNGVSKLEEPPQPHAWRGKQHSGVTALPSYETESYM